MKNFIVIMSLVFAVTAQARLSCNDKVMTAARALWSVNSGIDMKELTAEILSQKIIENGMRDFNVIVNTPKFPQLIQNVPYSVITEPSASNRANCFVKQVIAIDQKYSK